MQTDYRSHSKLIRYFHFWVIVVLYLGIALLYWTYYYTNLSPHGEWRQAFWYISIFEFRHDIHGSLFYIPVLCAIFIYWYRGILISWIVLMITIIPHLIRSVPDVTSLLINIVFLSLPVLIGGFIKAEIEWRNRERKMVNAREAERQVYMAQIFQAQEDERKRLAQELHDDTLQTLLVIANRTQSLLSEDNNLSQKAHEEAAWVRDTLLDVSQDLRSLSLDLHPGILDNMGLIPAIRWLTERFQKESHIPVQLRITGETRKLTAATDASIFRIIQEALNNIRRHAQATDAWVEMDFQDQDLRITVGDNGQGFTVPRTIRTLANTGQLGLIGIQERANFLNGKLDINSEPGQGTIITVRVKLAVGIKPDGGRKKEIGS